MEPPSRLEDKSLYVVYIFVPSSTVKAGEIPEVATELGVLKHTHKEGGLVGVLIRDGR